MAAPNKTPLQHFRSRTPSTAPAFLSLFPAVAASSGATTLSFLTSSLTSNVLQWAIDGPSTIIASNTVVTGTAVSGSNTVLTLSAPLVGACPTTQAIRLQQLREGELFINTADNRLAFGGYPQTATGNSDIIGVIDLIPSIKNNAGLALRVADNGLSLQWGNITAAGGAVNAVWAGQQTNPLTSTANQSSGILTSPQTSYMQTLLNYTVTNISTVLADQTFDITITPAITNNDIIVGRVLAATQAQLNQGIQARVNLIRSTTVINVTPTQLGTTPWGNSGTPTTNTIWNSGLGGSGIQGTGFVTTDVAVLPYMQARNRAVLGVMPYAVFNSTTQDTGISTTARNPATMLPAPFASTAANVVDLAQGGFGIGLTSRADLVNAAAAQQTIESGGTYTPKSYSDWTTAGFTPADMANNGFYFRIAGQNGAWPQWTGTNRRVYTSDGASAAWNPLPQPIQNQFYRLTSNASRISNKGLYFGTASWLGMAQNAAPDSTPGAMPGSKISVTPSNQDLVLDIVQTAAVPISSGGTGITIRGETTDTYWDQGNSRLTASLAWAIPAYNATRFDGELDKILPPFTYDVNTNTDPSASTSYVMSYKGVNQLPTWTTSLQGFQLQGTQLPATNTFTNSNRPLRLEGLGRFGVWMSANSYFPYVADGTIQAPLQVTNQDLRIQGSDAAADSRLILSKVTTPTTSGNGILSARFDSGSLTVNNGQGNSFNQVAEDYVTLSSTTISTDFTNSATVVSNIKPNVSTNVNIVLAHVSGSGRGSIAQFLANGNKSISGVVFFTVAADASIMKSAISITTTGGLGTPIVLRPLAGIVIGQYLVLSWWSNGSQCFITVAAGD